jgi:FKBP-type peptidyl-prolyl cis-trans isomerase (trigger factor)
MSIAWAKVTDQYTKTLKNLAKDLELPGFRKGHAPLAKAEEKIGKPYIYEEVVKELVPELYMATVQEHKLKPIMHPELKLVTAEENKDWQIQATACEAPTFQLDKALKDIKGLLTSTKIWTPDKAAKEADNKDDQPKELAEDQKMQNVIEFLLKEVELDVPQILVAQQSDRLLSNFIDQLTAVGLDLEKYLASTGKTGDEVRNQYIAQATADLKMDFILAQASKDLKIEATKAEVDKIIDQARDAEIKKTLDTPEGRLQVESGILRRKTLEKLVQMAA